MTQAHGHWLREQRQARGWTAHETARQLRAAARSAGDKLPDNRCLLVMIYRWEDDRSGISERSRLHYCRALGIPAADFGTPQPEPPLDPPATLPASTALMLAEAALLLAAALQEHGIIPDLTHTTSATDLATRLQTARRELDQARQ